MINSAQEFITLSENNDPRAIHEESPLVVWQDIIRSHPESKESMALNKTLPHAVLTLLAGDSSSSVRFSVAMKRKCSEEIFKQLAQDKDETVRARVAWNPKTPKSVLDILHKDASALVQNALKHAPLRWR